MRYAAAAIKHPYESIYKGCKFIISKCEEVTHIFYPYSYDILPLCLWLSLGALGFTVTIQRHTNLSGLENENSPVCRYNINVSGH